jgi:hypothetical protein
MNWNERYSHKTGAREFEDCSCGQYPKIRRLVEGLNNAMNDHRNHNTEMTKENVENHLVSLISTHVNAINQHFLDLDRNATKIHKDKINELKQQYTGM